MVFFGAMSVGSALWGQVAAWLGLLDAHWVAAATMLLAMAASWRFKLQHSAAIDLSPSRHWPMPGVLQLHDSNDGPVMVTVEYHVTEGRRAAFLLAVEELGLARRRDGAYAWAIYADAERPGRMLETFYLESWAEHLRQHERVTKADAGLQQAIRQLTLDEAQVTHFISARAEKPDRPQ
jgi:hypothetical protein